MTKSDNLLNELTQMVSITEDHALAQRHAPILRFDMREPFLPLTLGYTIFRSSKKSSSSKFVIDPDGGIAIEYAIWWDWDIQHLYELEHVWVYLDNDELLVKVEASAHGSLFPMVKQDGTLPFEDERITIYSEPGKHGFAPHRDGLLERAERTNLSCGERAGNGGIHTGNPFGVDAFGDPTEDDHQRANEYMQKMAFTPSYDFSQSFDLRTVPFITWVQLQDWIPRRIIWWQHELLSP